ncbi:expansin EXLX1 family cellulose-binding protein [Nocardia sp. NPDC020380]|uniref:expansin EXLX1 family cellulose-binding protein n=1 Tax=Nocardia sp. NPDC020380 TaxID=3364309 RepID=UPI00379A2866
MIRPQPVSCRNAEPVTTVVTLPAPTPPSSATTQQVPPVAPAPTVQGQARFYAFSQGVACSLPDLPLDGYYVGVPTDEYAGSAPCGSYVNIDGPLGSVRAQIVDRCPGCPPHQYDLSRTAFAAIANTADGVVPIRITAVHDPSPAPQLYYRVQQSSSADWLGLLVSGTGNPINQVDLQRPGGTDWLPMRRGYDNYWTLSGAGAGPFTIRVTDAYGHAALIPGVAITPGQVQQTGIRLYNDPAPVPPTTPAPPPSPVVVTTVMPAPSDCKD